MSPCQSRPKVYQDIQIKRLEVIKDGRWRYILGRSIAERWHEGWKRNTHRWRGGRNDDYGSNTLKSYYMTNYIRPEHWRKYESRTDKSGGVHHE